MGFQHTFTLFLAVLCLSLILTSGQPLDNGPSTSPAAEQELSALEQLENTLREDFAPEIIKVKDAYKAFEKAKSDLDPKSLTKGGFSVENLKSKVTYMLEKKKNYVTERWNLRNNITQAVFNKSASFWAELRNQKNGSSAGDVSEAVQLVRRALGVGVTEDEDEGSGGEDAATENNSEAEDFTDGESIVDVLLDESDEQDDEEAVRATNSPSHSTKASRLDRQNGAVRSRKAGRGEYWANRRREMSKKGADFVNGKLQQGKKDWRYWRDLNRKRYGKKNEGEKNRERKNREHNGKNTDGKRHNDYSAEQKTLLGMKQKLWSKFEEAIKGLNDSRNAFFQAKDEMVQMARAKNWRQVSHDGNTTFHLDELLRFKAKIREMVSMKKKYAQVKSTIRQDMLGVLSDILWEFLEDKKVGRKGKVDAVNISEDDNEDNDSEDEKEEDIAVGDTDITTAANGKEDNAVRETDITTATSTNGAGGAGDSESVDSSIVDANGGDDDTQDLVTEQDQIVVETVVKELTSLPEPVDIETEATPTYGLPFANSLALSVDPLKSELGGWGGREGSGVVAMVAIGLVAVAAAAAFIVVVVAGMHRKRDMYTRMA